MGRFKRIAISILAATAMLILILDSRTALAGAQEGIMLCLKTVIPSLFPFFVLAPLIANGFSGSGKLLHPLERLCGAPAGTGGLILSGFFCGHPVGATVIHSAWIRGELKKRDAERMLGYCSQTGPAFLFGIVPILFRQKGICWVLWGILIFSSLLTAALLPCKARTSEIRADIPPITPVQALRNAVISIGIVCGWILLFRIVLKFADRFLAHFLAEPVCILLSGMLEISNGCISLTGIAQEGLRFLMLSVFLSFGGFCAAMQTVAAAGDLSCRCFTAGKLLQTMIAFLMAAALQPVLFAGGAYFPLPACVPGICLIIGCIFLFILHDFKKEVAFTERLMYNKKKSG